MKSPIEIVMTALKHQADAAFSPAPHPSEITTYLLPRFPMGKTYVSHRASEVLVENDVNECWARHATGDWGLQNSKIAANNDVALKSREGVIGSIYKDGAGEEFWIITILRTPRTIVVLPSDYDEQITDADLE